MNETASVDKCVRRVKGNFIFSILLDVQAGLRTKPGSTLNCSLTGGAKNNCTKIYFKGMESQ